MEEKQSVINFRIDADLKTAFERVAKELDQTTSQLLRGFIRATVAEAGMKESQGDLFKAPKKARRDEIDRETAPRKKKQPKTSGNKLLNGLMGRVK
jgi:antitoxin component of RelBE/YafQ-DinJ toxin-antitoxin module